MTADNMELIKQEAEVSDVTSQTELPAEATSAGSVDTTDEGQQRPASGAGSQSSLANVNQDEGQSTVSPIHSHSENLRSPSSEVSNIELACKVELVDNNDETDVLSESLSRTSSPADDIKVETSTWLSAGDRESPIPGASGPNGTSFLQKLESFVASLDDKTKAEKQNDGNSWRQMHAAIRGVRVPHASVANNSTTAGAGLTCPVARFNTMSAWNMLAQYTNKTLPPTDAPLDLSVKHRSPDSIAESGLQVRPFPVQTKISAHPRELSYVRGGGYATTTSNGNSLACLERDFGENSAILTRLGHGEVSQQIAPARNFFNPSAGFLQQPLLQTQQLQHSFEPVSSDSAPQTTNNRMSSGRKRTAALRKATTLSTSANLKSQHQLPAKPTTATSTVRCLQCSRMFPSLPELTIHMIQTAHYANIIGCALPAAADADFDVQSVESSGRETPLSHPGYSPSLPIKGARHSAGTGTMPLPFNTVSDGKGNRKIWRPDFGSVSPARSLDDESVSSTGLTEPESLSPCSSASPVSTTRLMENSKGVDQLGLVSQLLQIQPLLAGGYFDVRGGLPSMLPLRAGGGVPNRERNLGGVRSLKDADSSLTKILEPGSEVAVDLRRHHHGKVFPVDAFYANGIVDPTATGAVPTIHLAKLLDDIWSRRKKNGVAMKRSAVPMKKDRTAATVPEKRAFISSDDGKRASRDGSRHRKAANDSRIQPIDSKCSDDTNHSSSSSVHSMLYCGSSVENGGLAGRPTSGSAPTNRSPISVPVSSYLEAIVSDRMRNGQMQVTTSTAGVAVDYGHHGNSNNVAEGDSRGRNETPGLRKTVEETEYSARFGKYCRLARELAGKSE